VQALQFELPVHVAADAPEASAMIKAHAKTMKLRLMTLLFLGWELNWNVPMLPSAVR